VTRQLSQLEIDAVFRKLQAGEAESRRNRKAAPFDFRRPDRIPKSQIRAIHVLHDNFVRNLVSSLSAYLRSYLVVNLVSVEQLSYLEFLEGLPSPTCMISVGLKPYEGYAVLELNPALVFPVIEMLLGGSGRTAASLRREVTEIEQNLLEGLFRIILHDLREAWKSVATIDFTMESLETEPQFLQIMAPNEPVVSIGIEVRIGESAGMMNLAIPSITIKMMRQRFDQQWFVRRGESTEQEQSRVLRLIRPAALELEACIRGPELLVRDMIDLRVGQVLCLDYPISRPVSLLCNGKQKFQGFLTASGSKRGMVVGVMPDAPVPPTAAMQAVAPAG
jgi:flagellar motor switch protein FliM